MSEIIEIEGGVPLSGSVQVGGAKNAALPVLIACLLTQERCTVKNVPFLYDVGITLHLLEHFGAVTERRGSAVCVNVPALRATDASYSLVKALRASFWVLAPLLARGGAARVALPGGDAIGARPVDIHLDALSQMGADIRVKHGIVMASAPYGLKPAEIAFRFPSVGATHQVLMAAALTRGVTILRGAAREPEIVEVARFLSAMGASIEGAGEEVIRIEGRGELGGAELDLCGDRIEAATYILAGAATGGSLEVVGFDPETLAGTTEVFERAGISLERLPDGYHVSCRRLSAVDVTTAPFPGFATDIQAPLMAALTLAEGESSITEQIFEGRFGHAADLCRMGAKITVSGRVAQISGVEKLSAAPGEVRDIRAGACLVIAALAANGVSQLSEVSHLRRGYSELERKLLQLGARVSVRVTDAEDFMFTGC